MAKEQFQRTKPHVNVGTIGHVDHGKSTLTAAIVEVQARKGLAKPISYADITKGGTVRDETKTVTIAVSHVEYESDTAPLRARRLPRPRRLREEHDHRRGADGRRDSGGERGGRPDAADPRAHSAGPPGRCAGHRGFPEQGGPGGRSGIARPGRDGNPRSADQVSVSWRQDADHSRQRHGGPGGQAGRREGHRRNCSTAIDSVHPAADARSGQAVPDVHRRRVQH